VCVNGFCVKEFRGFPFIFVDLLPNWGHNCLAEVGTQFLAEVGTYFVAEVGT
jgi:hypothetical protein